MASGTLRNALSWITQGLEMGRTSRGPQMANPMYRQIAEDLRAQIKGGDLEPGQQLRSEIELRNQYGPSRNTIRDAAGRDPASIPDYPPQALFERDVDVPGSDHGKLFLEETRNGTE